MQATGSVIQFDSAVPTAPAYVVGEWPQIEASSQLLDNKARIRRELAHLLSAELAAKWEARYKTEEEIIDGVDGLLSSIDDGSSSVNDVAQRVNEYYEANDIFSNNNEALGKYAHGLFIRGYRGESLMRYLILSSVVMLHQRYPGELQQMLAVISVVASHGSDWFNEYSDPIGTKDAVKFVLASQATDRPADYLSNMQQLKQLYTQDRAYGYDADCETVEAMEAIFGPIDA